MTTPGVQALLALRAKEGKVRAAILERYEFTGDKKHRVRRLELYELAAGVLGVEVGPQVAVMVKRLMQSHGARLMSVGNARMFSRMRAKAAELVPGDGKTVAQMRRAWFNRLRDEQLAEDPKRTPNLWAYRAEVNSAVFERMRKDYWRRRRELDVWGLYAIEGLPVREVALKLGMKSSTCGDIIARFRRELGAPGGHPTEGQETGSDDEEREE